MDDMMSLLAQKQKKIRHLVRRANRRVRRSRRQARKDDRSMSQLMSASGDGEPAHGVGGDGSKARRRTKCRRRGRQSRASRRQTARSTNAQDDDSNNTKTEYDGSGFAHPLDGMFAQEDRADRREARKAARQRKREQRAAKSNARKARCAVDKGCSDSSCPTSSKVWSHPLDNALDATFRRAGAEKELQLAEADLDAAMEDEYKRSEEAKEEEFDHESKHRERESGGRVQTQ